MLAIDFTAFREAVLKDDPTCIPLEERAIGPYLFQNVITPFLNGEEVRLNSLDYTLFTPEDVSDSWAELKATNAACGKINCLAGAFKQAAPIANTTKSFF